MAVALFPIGTWWNVFGNSVEQLAHALIHEYLGLVLASAVVSISVGIATGWWER